MKNKEGEILLTRRNFLRSASWTAASGVGLGYSGMKLNELAKENGGNGYQAAGWTLGYFYSFLCLMANAIETHDIWVNRREQNAIKRRVKTPSTNTLAK